MRIFVQSVFLFLFLLPANAHAGPNKTVRDWSAYCSNVLTCNIVPKQRGEGVHGIDLVRKAGANREVTLRFSIDGTVQEGTPVVIEVPGEMPSSSFDVSESKQGLVEVSDPKIYNMLVPALRSGQEMLVRIATKKGDLEASVSLSGISAIFLFVDEAQGRIGKVDALVARGEDPPEYRALGASEIQSTSQLPAAVSKVWRSRPHQCADDTRDLIEAFGGTRIEVGKLKGETESEVFYLLPCGGPGAYNLIYAGIVYAPDIDVARMVSFPTLGENGPTTVQTIVNASWDETSSRLTAYYKGRGLGDCGTSSTWEWSGTVYGRYFTLVEERRKDDCDGVYDEWPLVWPVQK